MIAQRFVRIFVNTRSETEVEMKLSGKGCVFPGDLLRLGGGAERIADTLEHVLQGTVWRVNVLQKSSGIFAIAPLAVERNLTWRSGIRDDGAAGGIHGSQSARRGRAMPGALERIVTAGVEDDDVRRRRAFLHRFNDPVQGKRRMLGVELRGCIGVHGGEVILSIDLHTVAGEEEK